MAAGILTIERHLKSLLDDRELPDIPPKWPPDVFALTMSLLHRSGAYVRLLEDWPPTTSATWTDDVRKTGGAWRSTAGLNQPAPDAIEAWWKVVVSAKGDSVTEVRAKTPLWQALIQLAAAADEACAGAGLPAPPPTNGDPMAAEMEIQLVSTLQSGSTLCRDVSDDVLRVLPKTHTPQSGATLRSLSHHLALVPHTDVRASWQSVQAGFGPHGLNLVLIPYPSTVLPNSFAPIDGDIGNLPKEFGFFTYTPPEAREAADMARRCVDRARKVVGRVDGVILPELALDERARHEMQLLAREERLFVVAGVGRTTPPPLLQSTTRAKHENLVYFTITSQLSERVSVEFEQHKHHRWKLDRSQIIQYGLGGRLDPSRHWWEATGLKPRELQFVAMDAWLTMCVLICEDLARQDPVSQIVRAVAPNLVIALLMDGPQTSARWPARYATVLAEDPGCSVLTLTCTGMMDLSRPPAGVPRARAIGLWKDPTGGTTEIDLPEGASAVVLSLAREEAVEWTADGRRHATPGGRLVLAGYHPVRV